MNKYAKFINVYKQAKRFKYVAEKLTQITGENSFADKFYGDQFATNGIFAIELYLKALYCYENLEFIKGHYLDELYSKLSEKLQNELKNEKADIKEYFEEYSKGFEKWRYSFESKELSIRIDHTMEVLKILDDMCEKYYKELNLNEQI